MLEGYQIVDLLTTLIITSGLVLVAYSPLPRSIGQAIAHRLMHGRTPKDGALVADARVDELADENVMLKRQLTELEDRLEFAERMIAQARDRTALGTGKAG